MVDLSLSPIDSIADVIAALEAIDQSVPESDGLKWFNGLYLNVTKSVDRSVGDNQWNNAAWMARLDVVFARLYLNALAASSVPGQSVPACWQVFFNARHDARLARIQFALAGMSAHINHDLSIAVVETCREFNFTLVHGSPVYKDFCRVNTLLNALIDQTKQDLMVGLLGDAIPELGRLEDLVASFGIEAAREVAWTNAEILDHARSVPGLADRFLDGLDHAATLAGAGLLAPVGV